MVSQFVSPDKVNLLGDIDFNWPEGTHAIGRLDNNSEGLLILTTNKRVTKLLFESDTPHKTIAVNRRWFARVTAVAPSRSFAQSIGAPAICSPSTL